MRAPLHAGGVQPDSDIFCRKCCDTSVAENDTDPVLLRSVAEQLATEAAAFVRQRRAEVFGDLPTSANNPSAVRAKSTPTDPVTVVDTETERLLRERLAVLRPGEHVLGEEEGGSPEGDDGQLTWVLDPIDGTVNFVYGIEVYAVSVGVQRDGVSVAGAVANVPAGAVYSAALGHGAHLQRAGVRTATAGQRRHRSVNVVGRHRIFLCSRATGTAGRGPGRSCYRWCATCGGSDRAHSICAWLPPAISMPTTKTAFTSGTGPQAR